MAKENLQLYFKEFIKTDSLSRGIDKIKKTPDYVCDLFVYEPRNIEEAQLGTLFMLGKIEKIPRNKYKNFDFLLNLLISVIKREFYSDFKRPALEALEASLNKANLYLADFTEKGSVEWIGNLDFVCGVFSDNTLHISQVGKPIIKLFREATVSHIENKFPIRRKSHPLKTFGNIVSGTILNGDKIILGTKNILNIMSLTALKKLSEGNCYQIIEALEELTKDKISKTPLICLALEIKAERVPEEIVACMPQISPLARLAELGLTKQSKFKTAISNIIESLIIFKKLFVIIFLGFYKIITFLTKHLPLFSKIKNLFEKNGIKDKYQDLKIKVTEFKNYRIKAFYQQNKPAFLIISLLIILLLILPFFAVQKIGYYLKLNNFNKLSAEIQEVQNKTDAALIYQDKEKAKALIQKNQSLLANLLNILEKSSLKKNEGVLNKIASLQKKYQEQEDSINNVIRIKTLEETLDFSNSGFIVNPVGINRIKDNLYFYELDSGILYKFDLSAKEKKGLTLVFVSAKDELRKMISLENEQIVLFGQSGKVYLYNSKTNDNKAYSFDPAVPVETIKDIKSFFSNIYILNTEQKNIIKYSLGSIKEETIKGSAWLSAPDEELKNAQSMAIDGSMYILDSNGLIIEYFKGKKIENIQPLLEKPLAGENKIFTGSDFKNFYISDSKNKRLIVLNKQGEIINQYINDEFINLQDFWVTKDEKEIYLLCGKKVFKITL